MTKCIIYWLPKGSRTPKQQGLATAPGSVCTIDALARSAREGRGRLFIVDAPTAAAGREIIRRWRSGGVGGGMATVIEAPDRFVAIGAQACLAVGGASFKAQAWDARIQTHGRVTVEQTRALNATTVGEYSLDTAFGQGLGVKR